MKNLFTIFATVLLTINVFAQLPEKMTYQAVIRNSSNALVVNTQVGMRISILQGSPSGTEVFVETLTPATNDNGLVSIEIGSEVGFSSIDWSAGSFFIKTETDPEGGTNYTIIGTSQLLSVPYAMHSKTAEKVLGTITESDPIYTNSEAFNITATDIVNLAKLSGLNSGDQNLDSLATKTALGDSINHLRSEIPDVSGFLSAEIDPIFRSSLANKITTTDTTNWNNKQDQLSAGSGINIVGNTISSTGSGAHYVGELYGGGVVFWVDHTGEHGLIVSMVDQGDNQEWSVAYSGIIETNDWDGESNTNAIIEKFGNNPSAAKLCYDYTNVDYGTGIYNDWFLPSIGELNHLWNNLLEVQKSLTTDGNDSTVPLIKTSYWSSTQSLGGGSPGYQFSFRFGYVYSLEGSLPSVRAIRAF